MSTSFAARRLQRGVSLIELMLVILLVAVVAAIAFPSYSSYRQRARDMQAAAEIAAMSLIIDAYAQDFRRNPPDLNAVGLGARLDPWGRPYVYYDIALNGRGHARKDHALNPLNTDFDLYSKGPDGVTKPQITQRDSLDDILRARNGKFVGVAASF